MKDMKISSREKIILSRLDAQETEDLQKWLTEAAGNARRHEQKYRQYSFNEIISAIKLLSQEKESLKMWEDGKNSVKFFDNTLVAINYTISLLNERKNELEKALDINQNKNVEQPTNYNFKAGEKKFLQDILDECEHYIELLERDILGFGKEETSIARLNVLTQASIDIDGFITELAAWDDVLDAIKDGKKIYQDAIITSKKIDERKQRLEKLFSFVLTKKQPKQEDLFVWDSSLGRMVERGTQPKVYTPKQYTPTPIKPKKVKPHPVGTTTGTGKDEVTIYPITEFLDEE